MVQILGFVSDTWNSISFSIINGVFGLVAKTYDMLLQIINNGNKSLLVTDYFEQFTTIMYVLAGVFMLFRIAISLIQMLINPDQMNDKQAGAGKIVTRIITCIIMLMIFTPNGILFGKTGLFAEVEDALLADDGIISQLMNLNLEESDDKNLLIDNVQAAPKQLTCYYINVMEHTREQLQGNMHNTLKLGNVFKVEFFSDGSGKKKISGTNYSYSIRDDQRIAGKDEYGNYAPFTMDISKGNVFNGSFPSSCPKYFKKTSSTWSAQKSVPNGYNSNKDNFFECKTVANSGEQTCMNKGVILAGEGNNNAGFQAMHNIVKKLQLEASGTKPSFSIITNNKYLAANTNTSANDKEGNREYLNNLVYGETSLPFAQGVASSLQECVAEKATECSEAQKEMFKTVDGNKKIKDLMNDDYLDVSFIASVITGLGLIVYLIFLCIEVLVRRLKLYLLEMIAPLPIVCYINPKDKTFNQWFKMYMSTYADLFIKLVAISMAVNLFAATINDFWSTDGMLTKFFYIIAILIFAKVVPTMISKIFGLDSMGGSFKDIANLGKKAAFAGVGAAALGASGWASGGIAGLARGLAMGAGAGWNGKIGESMKNMNANNYQKRQMKDDGLSFRQRAMVAAYKATGLQPSGKKAEEQMKLADGVVDKNKSLKDYVEGEVRKKGQKFRVGHTPIAGKNHKVVTGGNEAIDMKTEYKRQSNLTNMTNEQWNSMSQAEREAEFGMFVANKAETLTDAQLLQDDRVVTLQDYAVANKINEKLSEGDEEMTYMVGKYNDAADEAIKAGVKVNKISGTVTKDTLSNNKKAAYSEYSRIEKENADTLKIQKHIDNK